MSSRRFPGKVLAPFRGRPLLAHVVDRVRAGLTQDANVVVATSDDPTDDPLAAYAGAAGFDLYRGPLDDVLGRFARCALGRSCDWVLRISADSPLMNAEVVRQVVSWRHRCEADLITTVFPRTLPPGWSVEVLRRDLLDQLDRSVTAPDEREHVTLHCYRNPGRFRILGLGDSARPESPALAVDTPDDLRRLEHAGPIVQDVQLEPVARETV